MEVLTAAVIALGLISGVPVVIAVLMAMSVASPAVAAAALFVLVAVTARSRVGAPDAHRESRFLAAVAAELRSGANVSVAIADAAARAPGLDLDLFVRLSGAAADPAALQRAAVVGLPVSGALVAPATRIAIASGGKAAPMFERLALRAHERAELDEEIAVATSQARASVKVLVVLPVTLLVVLGVSGNLARLASAGPLGLAALVVGGGLQLAGVGVVALLLRGVAR